MGAAAIDYGALVSQQRIVLRNIPRGEARILFNARDFGNFLVHPLMADAAAKAVDVSCIGTRIKLGSTHVESCFCH